MAAANNSTLDKQQFTLEIDYEEVQFLNDQVKRVSIIAEYELSLIM